MRLIRAGMHTTVQDAGRYGYQQLGVSRCGALDPLALRIANLLVGNPPESAVLEITLGQCVLEFQRDVWFALTGAGCHAQLDGKPVWTGWRFPARAGQKLKFNAPQRGMRSYLAVAGGIEIPLVMGSASTDLKARIGGLAGRLLQDGDTLAILPEGRKFTKLCGVKQLSWGNRVRALLGPEYHEFSKSSQETFWRLPWQLTPQSNRMGYRLQGQNLERTTQREIYSHGLVPGVVQVPQNGLPIVLMNDAQTTGGYPRIASVIEADMFHLAQLRLGETLHFIPCTLPEAQKVRHAQQRYLDLLTWQLGREEAE